MRAHVFYNVTKDEHGRFVAMMSFGRHVDIEGHYFQYVTTYEDCEGMFFAAAENIYRDMNAVDGTERCIRLKVRSMSVGDVIVFVRESDRAEIPLLCEGVGFACEVAFPEVDADVWPLA
jgi:hypothetical protein